jgi:hypothetical protein
MVPVIWSPAPPSPEEQDPLLDRFMPSYDVAERHHVRIAAPSGLTFAAAREVDLQGSPLVRDIIKAREVNRQAFASGGN